jgi:anti-sigma-K factor RskA
MHCAGFTSDTYDRYVLGLLEEPDRSHVEAQIREQCPACLAGVQRSMNLWLVFAETLENAEPSEDFRGRIVRIAELSRKVLTFPKNSAVREQRAVPISTLLVICAITSILLVSSWYAARASIRMDAQPPTADLERLAHEVANNQLKLDQEIERRRQLETQLGSSGRAAIAQTRKVEDALTKAQAVVEQQKTEIAHDKQNVANTNSLLDALAHAGARLLPLKASEAAGKALGYAVLAEKSRLVFVCSNMPKPSADHTFQLWILRKESPSETSAVSAGVFMPAENGSCFVDFHEAALLSDVSGVLVTEEPIEGKYDKPSGPKLFEAGTAEENKS